MIRIGNIWNAYDDYIKDTQHHITQKLSEIKIVVIQTTTKNKRPVSQVS